MNPDLIAGLVKQYGFPIVSSVGMGYFVYFIYGFVTTKLMPLIGETNGILVQLIDRIRMLDNDLIRLNQKLNIVLQLRGKEIESERHLHDVKTAAAAQERELQAAAFLHHVWLGKPQLVTQWKVQLVIATEFRQKT